MAGSSKFRNTQTGAALLAALGLLFLFAILGTAYVRFATLEYQTTDLKVDTLHSRTFARGGIQAGIGSIQKALAIGEIPQATLPLSLPLYDSIERDRAEDKEVLVKSNIKGAINIEIIDESGKINLNCASVRVLQTILKVDGNTARNIRSSLPHSEEANPPDEGVADKRWLTHVDDLLTRKLIEKETFESLNTANLTVSSVLDPASPQGYINLNSAPVEVIAAVLNITPEVSEEVVEARPFSSIEQLLAVSKNTPAMFNIKPSPDAPNSLPKELSFTSQCYRIKSIGEVIKELEVTTGADVENVQIVLAKTQAEAVVIFPSDGSPIIREWSEGRAK